MNKNKYPEEKNGEKEKIKFLSLWILEYFLRRLKNER